MAWTEEIPESCSIYIQIRFGNDGDLKFSLHIPIHSKTPAVYGDTERSDYIVTVQSPTGRSDYIVTVQSLCRHYA